MEKTPEQIEYIKLQKRLTKRFHKACADYTLIEDGDHILIGLSGGKDSLALVELLGRRQKIHVPHFRVTAIHISVSNIGYQVDLEYLRNFCTQHGVEFVHRITEIAPKDEGQRSPYAGSDQKDSGPIAHNSNPCFLCSWYRRKALFEAAKELGCNKIALGHHKDDIVETVLLNMVFQGTFATIAPKLQMEKFPMLMIRPLCLIHEEDIQRYAELSEYHKQVKSCPFEKDSSRSEMKQILARLKEMNPHAVDSIWGAMENIKTEYLPNKIR